MPMSRRSARKRCRVGLKSSPANSMVPLSGRSSPLMQRSKVLFPEPLRPMIATTSPGSTASDTSASARCAPKRLEMLFNAKSGIDAPLEGLRQQRKRPAEDEIERRHDRIDDHRPEGRVGHQLPGASELDKADNRSDRGALDQLDRETNRRWDRDARRLRQDDVPELFGKAEREAFRGLPLRPRNGLDRTAPDLAEERARIQGEGKQHGRPGIDLKVEEDGEAIIGDEELHQHGRPLEQRDVPDGEPLQGSGWGDPQDRDEETDDPAAYEGAERQQQGPGDRLEEIEELPDSEAASHR